MNNNNEENSRYPLDIIKSIRKKDEKRKKVLKISLTAICFVLVFAIGFTAGFYYGDSRNLNGDSAIATSSKEGSISSDANIPSDAIEDIYTEADMLDELKLGFINKMTAVCPDAQISFAIKNLDTGETVMHNNVQVNSASVIKLFIMETVYKEAAAGNYTITDEKKEALFKMITDSDNKAANMFIDDFGGVDETRKIKADNTITQTIKNSGYKYTEANRKMYDTSPPGGPTGYENYTCAEDVIRLLEGIYQKNLFAEPYNTEAMELLKQQVRLEKIPAKIKELHPDVIVANKTGELTQVENDVAIIMGENFNIALAVFVSNIPKMENGDYDVELHKIIKSTIADFGLEVVEAYKANNF